MSRRLTVCLSRRKGETHETLAVIVETSDADSGYLSTSPTYHAGHHSPTLMHRCSIKVEGIESPLDNHDAISSLFVDVAHVIGMDMETDPQGMASPTTIWYFAPLRTVGWMIFCACPNEGWFQLDVCSEKPVEKQRILSVVGKQFHRIGKHLVPAGG